MDPCKQRVVVGFFFHIINTIGQLAVGDDSLEELGFAIPGVPGDDYPIYSEPPETSFSCDGQVNGGYYSDPEAECQAFHICAGESSDSLNTFSFLCPNGTLFQQQYFVCDWWFNVDCAQTEQFYFLNEKLEEARNDATATNSERRLRKLQEFPAEREDIEIENTSGKNSINNQNSLTTRARSGFPTGRLSIQTDAVSNNKLRRKGKRRGGSGLRRANSILSSEDETRKQRVDFPVEGLPSVEGPELSDLDPEVVDPINSLYGAPTIASDQITPIEEQIFSFEAEIPPENARRSRDLDISNAYQDQDLQQDSSYSKPDLETEFERLELSS